ncbi:MAG: RNA polymerase sigma factor [Waddliaceae bacterium]
MNLVSQKTKETLPEPALEKIAEDLRDGRLKEENFKLLFEVFHPNLFKLFANHGVFPTEDIRDLIQNTFFKVYKNIGQCRDCRKFDSWIFSIARNEMIDWFRKKKGKQTKSLDAATDSDKPENLEEIKPESDLLQKAINQEQLDKLSSAIQKLPKRMQQCFQMFYRENYSYKEIAIALRISEETVKSQLYQGRKRLKELLGDEIDF